MTPAPADFNRIARPYRWLEYLTFGRALERTRFQFLTELAACRSALVLGDGDGRFLARLLAQNPELHADAVDSSGTMLRLLRQRCHASTPDAADRLHSHHADARNFTPDNPCDLIATHFFLDCLTQAELAALACRLAQFAAPGTLWVVSEFRIPSGPMRLPARLLMRALYLAFRALTGLRVSALPDHHAALLAAGFHPIAEHLILGGLLTSELWQFSSARQTPEPPLN